MYLRAASIGSRLQPGPVGRTEASEVESEEQGADTSLVLVPFLDPPTLRRILSNGTFFLGFGFMLLLQIRSPTAIIRHKLL